MNLFQRISNIWALSAYRVEDKNLVGDKKIPILVDGSKPKKRLAIVMEDDPLEVFPTES